MYPLDTTRSVQVTDKKRVITPGNQETLEEANTLRSRPPTRYGSRKRTADVGTQDDDGMQDAEVIPVEPENSKSSKEKRARPIEEKLRDNIVKQNKAITELKRKLEESAEYIRNLESKPTKLQKEDTKDIIDEAIHKAADKYFSSTNQVEGKLSQLSIKNAELSAQVKVYQESFVHIKTQQDRIDSLQKLHQDREKEIVDEKKEAEKKIAELDTKYQVASKVSELYKEQQQRDDAKQEQQRQDYKAERTELFSFLAKILPNNNKQD